MADRALRRATVAFVAALATTMLTTPAASATIPSASEPFEGFDQWDIAAASAASGGVAAAGLVDDTPHLLALTFPVKGNVSYSDDFGACRGTGCSRGHEGNDLAGERLQPLLAAGAGTIRWARLDASGASGNMLILEDAEGWEYWYIHINNDSPGTDDGSNPPRWILAPGVEVGDYVEAGDHIAYMGDSGNAESTIPHLHFELHRPDGVAVNPWYSLRIAQGLPAGDWCTLPSNPPHRPDPDAGPGYWLVDANGQVTPRGEAVHHGDATSVSHTGSVTDLAPTRSGQGYWLSTTTGQVLSFGDAESLGDMAGTQLKAPIVGLDTTPSGAGYWLFAADGGVFSFGDADFYGSTGSLELNSPVIGMVRSQGGSGYLLLGADGGTFTFGDARFQGSMPGTGLCDPPTAAALVPTLSGGGYWILSTDGEVHGFGDAPLHGGARPGVEPVAMAVLPALGNSIAEASAASS